MLLRSLGGWVEPGPRKARRPTATPTRTRKGPSAEKRAAARKKRKKKKNR